ncbi:MAG TPA: hypothetical protein DDW65_16050 [Firmicutes bacterium]|jgi:AcrR family transcriptional regulator|nr:hypothetical protein [Bacillota bacterium]
MGRWSFLQVLKEEIRDKILQIAAQEFLEKGFQSSSTREIAARVNISKGNLYNYFSSKENLFNALLSAFYQEFNSFLKQLWAHETGENFTLENVEWMARTVAEFIQEHRQEFILIMDKSEGTKYAGFKKETITMLQNHFEKNLKAIYKSRSGSETSIMQIIATNFLEALLSISKNCLNNDQVIDNLELYLKYHIQGVTQFY